MIHGHVACGLTIAAVLLVASDAFAQAQTSFRQFLAAYRCSVVHRLERIYEAGDPARHRDRYLAITVMEHPHGYVQCMFFANRTRMLCEASSGYYFSKPGKPRIFWLSREARAALQALGFSVDDRPGNHALEFEVRSPPDFNAIADLMLKALHDAYDARASSTLHFSAPFAPRESSSCIPIS